MIIGITYNIKDEILPEAIINSEFCEEFDTPDTINAIRGAFEKRGHRTVRLGGDIRIVETLKRQRVDFVFNIAEGYRGRNRESHIPAVLEMLRIPYSGSDPLTLGLTLDKTLTKRVAFHAGIPTPRYHVIGKKGTTRPAIDSLRYPLITKPAWEGSSKGIYDLSKVYDEWGLKKSVKLLFERYPDQPVLIEEYIEGREITAGVIGNDPPRILGLMEVMNKSKPGEDIFYSLETKRNWKKLVRYASPPRIDDSTMNRIEHYALSAFREFGCRDIARVDFKLSKDHKIYMLEINPLPGLSPRYADLVIMARKNKIRYEDLIMSIFNHALSRNRKTKEILKYEAV
jgi:D-alanine-D-alanine ligase